MAVEKRFHGRERVRGKGSAAIPHQNDVRAVVAELAPQLGLDIDVEIQHRRGDGGSHDHGKQGRSSASATEHSGPHQHPQKHGGMRRLLAVDGDLLRGIRDTTAHISPRKANTGSSSTALRIAAALPAKVTATAMARITGKSTGAIVTCELKMERPIWRASNPPAAKPSKPPITASNVASAKKTDATAALPAPTAFITPTSARPSKLVGAIAAETASAEAKDSARTITKIQA